MKTVGVAEGLEGVGAGALEGLRKLVCRAHLANPVTAASCRPLNKEGVAQALRVTKNTKRGPQDTQKIVRIIIRATLRARQLDISTPAREAHIFRDRKDGSGTGPDVRWNAIREVRQGKAPKTWPLHR